MGLQGCSFAFKTLDTPRHANKGGTVHSEPSFSVGRNYIKWETLLNPRKIWFPPVQLKLGLMKQCVTALDNKLASFKCFNNFSLKLYSTKIKVGVFVRPQMKKIIEYKEFKYSLGRIKTRGTTMSRWFGASWGSISPMCSLL